MINSNQNIKLNRKFGFTIAVVLLIVAAFHLIIRHTQDKVTALFATVLLVVALFKPLWLNLPRILWDKLGHILGVINTYVLLTLFYGLVLTPVGLLTRLFGKDILKRKRSGNQTTYWETISKTEVNNMKAQF